MSKLTLSLVIHNHQPVGNFDHVFVAATDRAYDPMLSALERHPGVRLALHYSGPLLDWLSAHRPDHLDRLHTLVQREQVELLTGAYYEPILVSIPDSDKIGQIQKTTRFLQKTFDQNPTGAWIAERIWEPHLPRPLSKAGVRYTLLDDTPFKMVGLTEDDLFSSYITEEQGYTLQVFGSLTHLRHAIPWHPVTDVIDWLHVHSQAHPGGVAVLGDDGEKFGLWPGTEELCWGDHAWIERFFSALEENADWLRTRPLGEVVVEQPPRGRVYLPCASHQEVKYAQFNQDGRDGDHSDDHYPIRGGFWRSFLARYDEANQMHKKMLWVRRKVCDMPEGPEKTKALHHIWAAQSNCGYWHGVFGGVYLFHIRAVNYANLIAAEALAEKSTPSPTQMQVAWSDMDTDGQEEVILNTDQQVLVFKPSSGGALVEWDWRQPRYNILNTMTRRRESYHQRLREAAESGRLILPDQPAIPNGVRVKESDVHTRLFYDWYRRAAFLDHFLHPDTTPEAFYQAQYGEQGDFVNQPYTAQVKEGEDATLVLRRDGSVWVGKTPIPVQVEKELSLLPGSSTLQARYQVVNNGGVPTALRFGVEFNWGIVGGDSEYGYLKANNKSYNLDDFEGNDETTQLIVGSTLPDLQGEIAMTLDCPAHLWYFPLEVISNSKEGFERLYQGTCTLLWWELALGAGKSWETTMDFELRAAGNQ
jgi:alpha-amylase